MSEDTSDKKEIVTIDGPSGVGKSTLSRKVAAALGYTNLDTGAMYRAVGLCLQRLQIDLTDEQAVGAILAGMDLQLLPAAQEDGDVGVVVNGQDVSSAIRTPEAGMLASRVSAIPVVRKRLTEMQQVLGHKGKIVAEGRDTGTVVFPDARWKFYLEADLGERARRRVAQLRSAGQEVDAQELLVNGTAGEIRAKVRELRQIFPTGLIVSPSHEAILPDVKMESLDAMIEAARELN